MDGLRLSDEEEEEENPTVHIAEIRWLHSLSLGNCRICGGTGIRLPPTEDAVLAYIRWLRERRYCLWSTINTYVSRLNGIYQQNLRTDRVNEAMAAYQEEDERRMRLDLVRRDQKRRDQERQDEERRDRERRDEERDCKQE